MDNERNLSKNSDNLYDNSNYVSSSIAMFLILVQRTANIFFIIYLSSLISFVFHFCLKYFQIFHLFGGMGEFPNQSYIQFT